MFSEAVSINASGVVVGFSTLAETEDGVTLDFGDRHAVVFQNGGLTDLTPGYLAPRAVGLGKRFVEFGELLGRHVIGVVDRRILVEDDGNRRPARREPRAIGASIDKHTGQPSTESDVTSRHHWYSCQNRSQ